MEPESANTGIVLGGITLRLVGPAIDVTLEPERKSNSRNQRSTVRMVSERAERQIRRLLEDATAPDGAPPPLPEIHRRARERVALRELVQLGSRLWNALIILFASPLRRPDDDGG